MRDREQIAQVAHQKWANEWIAHFLEQIAHSLIFGQKRAIRLENLVSWSKNFKKQGVFFGNTKLVSQEISENFVVKKPGVTSHMHFQFEYLCKIEAIFPLRSSSSSRLKGRLRLPKSVRWLKYVMKRLYGKV